MIGILLIIIPLLTGITCHYISQYSYSDFIDIGMVGGYIIGATMTVCAIGVYINTSTYETQRNSIQQSLDTARESGNEYELATIQREVVEFNRRLDLDARFWYPHFRLWINDDILELDPVK